MCMSFQDCCSNNCQNGVCGDQCSADGSLCSDPSECCSDICIAGFCGPSTCPSDGSPCGDCIAQNCCSQILGCFGSPACIEDVTCFLGCVGGGNPIQCFLQCINDPQAFQAAICLGTNCGPGICF